MSGALLYVARIPHCASMHLPSQRNTGLKAGHATGLAAADGICSKEAKC